MPRHVLWELGEHTPGKHLVLRNYLNAWFPILAQTQDRIVFIDGFAGPGEYKGGEPGSPIIALRTLRQHAARGRFRAEILFFFVEKERGRVAHLRALVEAEQKSLPPNCKVYLEEGVFDATMTETLDKVEGSKKFLAPCFLMADPFGVSDTPMSVIARVMRHPKSEVYISFMYEAINRFKEAPEFEPHLDSLFGCADWRGGLAVEDPDVKKKFFFTLYERQLRNAGATHVVCFELYQGNRLVYAIFFGTKHLLGCDRMKQAIWQVAPFGDYVFRGTRGGQLGLEMGGADLARFGREIRAAFPGDGWVAIESAIEFAQSDRTDFHSGHVKGALRLLEDASVVAADPESRTRSKTYPRGTRFRFVTSGQGA